MVAWESMANDSWGNKPETGSSGLFVRIDADSEVRVRLVGKPYAFLKAFRDEKPKPRWASRCLLFDPETKEYDAKVVEFGAQVKTAIYDLCADDDWGDPNGYDIVIKRNGSGLDTKYSVVPKAKKAAPEDKLAEAKKIELVNLVDKDAKDEYNPFEDE